VAANDGSVQVAALAGLAERVAVLEAEVASLRSELAGLRGRAAVS
jgi:uncharacterized small protein (DUF1192 family)